MFCISRLFFILLTLTRSVDLLEIDEEVPVETQHAVCNVVTKEIEASAKATITRQLKGVCSSKELDKKINQLQASILHELLEIKRYLGMPSYSSFEVDMGTKPPSKTSSVDESPSYDYQNYVESEKSNFYNLKSLTRPKVKSGIYSSDGVESGDEIATFNDTVVEGREGALYFYYWKVEDAVKVLRKKDIYISSPQFTVLGHTMQLHLYPNYLNEYVGVLLKPDSNSFLKKHKISFLGRLSTQNVISSKILYGIKNEEKTFKIEPRMLNKNFISDNSLLIKLKIYLNS